ncbi:Mariner Mos1 transposase [Anthophora retusa]
MICSALGENAVTYKTCKKWFQRFRSGNFDFNDAERSGTLKKVEDEELEQLLNEDPCQTQQELAEELGVTQQAISVRLKKLGRVQKVGRWVPHVLSPESCMTTHDHIR